MIRYAIVTFAILLTGCSVAANARGEMLSEGKIEIGSTIRVKNIDGWVCEIRVCKVGDKYVFTRKSDVMNDTLDRIEEIDVSYDLEYKVDFITVQDRKICIWWDNGSANLAERMKGINGECGAEFIVNKRGEPKRIDSIRFIDLIN